MNLQLSSTASTITFNSSPATLSGQLAKMRVLVIDDEPANVALLEGILQDNGYSRIKCVTDSRIAITVFNEFQPDLVLLDLMMPHIDGLSILNQLRAEKNEVFLPVLVLTADVSEETKIAALRSGATDFLLKPFDQIEVLLRIANLLEIRRLHIQLDTQRSAFEESLHARMSELRDLKAEFGRLS